MDDINSSIVGIYSAQHRTALGALNRLMNDTADMIQHQTNAVLQSITTTEHLNMLNLKRDSFKQGYLSNDDFDTIANIFATTLQSYWEADNSSNKQACSDFIARQTELFQHLAALMPKNKEKCAAHIEGLQATLKDLRRSTLQITPDYSETDDANFAANLMKNISTALPGTEPDNE